MFATTSALARFSLLTALALCAAPAFAQSMPGQTSPVPSNPGQTTPQILDEAPASDNGRYAMQQTPDGFLRLDTRTGKVSYCAIKDGAARCALAADERDAYEREIALLKDGKSAKPASGYGPRLPTDDEIDRTLGVMQKIWRGMNRIIGEDPPKGGQL